MDKKVFKSSGLPIRKTSGLLPEIFQTQANDKFLGATLDALVQPGTLEKQTGYIGRSYGKSYNSKDVYLDVAKTLRHAYQLEPGVVVADDNGKVKNYYDYLDFKNQLNFFGSEEERDNRVTDQPHYTWTPPVDWDKLINYREYYWLPSGPDSVEVFGQSQDVVSSYRVRSEGNDVWIFYPDGLKRNPAITLYRGQTYEFDVNTPGDGFTIRTSNTLGAQSNYNLGVTNNGIEVGKVTFKVPNNAPDLLYYQSDSHNDRVGSFRIANINENTVLDIETEILGKQTYVSSNGVSFTNGLKINFVGNITPEKYKTGLWFVEGVGDNIRLVEYKSLELPALSNSDVDIVFDATGFDAQPFDNATSFPTTKDYITINRSSIDKNPWSRYNRWFHRSVVEYAASINGTEAGLSEEYRAKRPIIEYISNLQLFNHGAVAKQSVDLVDTFTNDVFSQIEGSGGYNIDNVDLVDGMRVLFTADTDSLVKNKIYVVNFITVQSSTTVLTHKQISLVEAEDVSSVAGECVIVQKGKQYGGKMFHYDGTTWNQSQEKLSVNQPPLFDAYDSNGTSLSDPAIYGTASTFKGTPILSYKINNAGVIDSELGFAISYLNINNVGDILFQSDWETQTFEWKEGTVTNSGTIRSGFYRINKDLYTNHYGNTWESVTHSLIQPVLQTVTVATAGKSVSFDTCIWHTSTTEKILFYKNGTLLRDSFTSTLVSNTRTFTFTKTTFVAGDVLTIKNYTDAQPYMGYYEFPDALEKNPLNTALETFTLGQAGDHLRSMTELADIFVGEFPGTSNLRDTVGYQNYGRRFLKQSGVAALTLPLLCDRNVNIIKSLRFAAKEYERFKTSFLRLAIELPYDFNDIEFVDTILTAMSQNKDAKQSFADSDMIGSGAYSLKDYTVEDEGITTFALSTKFDLKAPSSTAVYVYHNDRQLLVNKDYIFDSTFGFVRLQIPLVEGDNIKIREYYSTAFSFMPSTPTKLGLTKKYIPRIYVDDTYLTPTKVLQGHDGSITAAFDDFRDDLLLELELRIYNNIKTEYQEDIFDFDKTFGSYYDHGIHSREVLNKVLNVEFLRWGVASGISLYTNDTLDVNNPFTYTYDRALDRTGEVLMPRFWRGIYEYLYDTCHPHVEPWEMLGFSEKPTWWEDEYGPAPYTSENLILWGDLRDGIIRKGDRAGVYDRYKRPTLFDFIPVDEDGRLLSPIDSRSVIDYASAYLSNNFQFGDIAPVEYSWRRTSSFKFSMVIAACILRPFEFISLSLDRSSVKKNIIGQIVSNNTNTFVNRSDIISSLTAPVGLLSYIKDYLRSTSTTTGALTYLVNNFDIRLANRIGGFVDKAQHKYLLDSKNPNSTSSGSFVPAENYQVFFNVSSPIKSITYSGVVIEKQDNGWKVTGYDNLHTFFKYYDFFTVNDDPIISVGGVSENFVDWEAGRFYGSGILVRYTNKFYRAKESHTSGTTFSDAVWTQIPSVPVVGAIEAVKRTQWNKAEPLTLNYDAILPTVQSVTDFLLGYSEWLQDQGLVFDSFDRELLIPNNWEKSAKEFLFWSSHNWAPGALIALSPSATEVRIQTVGGVADNILDSFYEYSVAKSDGVQLPPDKIDVLRNYNEVVVSPVNTRDGIYFLKLNYVLKEHVVVFDDRTVFNDVIFDKGPGYRQERIKVLGFRTTDWDGDYTSPGFIYDNVDIQTWQPNTDYRIGDIVRYKEYMFTSLAFQQGATTFDQTNWERLDNLPESGLVTNFDYRISQIDDYYELDSVGLDATHKTLARHAIGYQQRDYLQDIIEDDVSQYKMYQGFIREKGTQNSITKMFDKVSSLTDDAVILNEEWAFLLGSFGGTDQSKEFEIKLKKEQLKLNPQPVLLNSIGLKQEDYYNYVLVNPNEYQVGSVNTAKFPTSYKTNEGWTGGYVYVNDVDFVVGKKEDLLVADITEFKEGSLVWVTFAPAGWEMLRYKITDVLVIGVVSLSQTEVSVTCNKPHNLEVGDFVGLTKILNLSGFYQVTVKNNNTFIVGTTGFKNSPEIDESSFCNIAILESARVSDIDGLVGSSIGKLPVGSLVWVDENENGKWEVVKRKQQYTTTQISEYGIAFPTGTGSSVAYLNARNQTIVSNPGAVVTTGDATRESAVVVYSQGTTGLIPLQILVPQDSLKESFLGSYGTTVSISEDGRWLAVGSPNASYVPSSYKEQFSASSSYSTDDTVLYAGKLWKANNTIIGDGSTIDLQNQDWTPLRLHEAAPLNKGILGSNPGYSKQGAVDIFEYTQGQWTFRHSIISPRPGHGELFGSSISFGKQVGIEGTSGDVTLVIKSIDSDGGITGVEAVGTSGLNDQLFQNVSGIDVSTTGSGATFDVTRAVGVYTVLVRNGGTRYAVGDKFKILGSRIGGTTPTNDLIITVTNVTTGGTIVGSETYTNVSGINSITPATEAIFNISRNRSTYTVTMVNAGIGYVARSIVRYNSRLYACVKDTRIDRGTWDTTRTYYVGDVVKSPTSTYYYTVLQTVSGVTPADDSVHYSLYQSILPTDQSYWQEVSGTVYAVTATPWIEKNSRTGELIRYTAGSSIFISGTQLGGATPANDITIYVNKVNSDTSIASAASGGFVYTGYGATGIDQTGIASSGNGAYNDIAGDDVSEPGSGAIFDIKREAGTYKATINVAGTRYNVGDEIKILGTSLGASKEAYYMSVAAPGSLDNTGRLYLYTFEGIDWVQADDPKFVGIYSSSKFYTANTVVWYNGNYWKALTDRPSMSGAPSAPNWEMSASTNSGMLPNKGAYADDGSTIAFGNDGQLTELLNAGDLYGYSSVMSKDATRLIVGAINADSAKFISYKGIWKSYDVYISGDTVRRNNIYYTLTAGVSLNEAPEVYTSSWEVDQTPIADKTGAVFIYNRDVNDVFTLVQTINSENINTFITDSADLKLSDKFGYSIKVSDDNSTLFVSAPQADINGIDQGSVYVFNLNTVTNTYEFVQKLNSFAFDTNEMFGSTMDLSPNGQVLAVAAASGQTYSETTFDKNTTAFDRYIAKFRDPVGRTGRVYVFEKYKTKYVLSEVFDKELLADGTSIPLAANEDFGHAIASSNDSIIIGSPAYRSEDPAFKEIRIGRIQKFTRTPGVKSWESYRLQTETVDINSIKTLSVYDPDKNVKLADLDIIDPYKGKILSVAEQAIDFKTSYDPAVYSYASIDVTADNSQYWGEEMVGSIWWNTSTVKWPVYEQDDLTFRIGNWATPVYGSTVDVYEWVKTTYLPSEWVSYVTSNATQAFTEGLSGTPLYADDTALSVKQTLDAITGQVTKTEYYYWVKNRQIIPVNSKRSITAGNIASYILNPMSAGVPFAALINKDTLLVYNLLPIVTGNDFLIDFEFYNNTDPINLIHREYQLLAENVAEDRPSTELELKWIDSLTGQDLIGRDVPDRTLPAKLKYGLSSNPRQSMFVNRAAAVGITVDYINNILVSKPFESLSESLELNDYEKAPSMVTNLYDTVVETRPELDYIATSKLKQAVLKANIVNGKIDTVDVVSAGYGYRKAPPVTIRGNGSGAEISTTINKLGQVTSATVVTSGIKYTEATLFVREFAVLVNTDSTVNNYWSIWSYDSTTAEFYRSATQSYDVRNYWTTVDWWETGYSEKSRIVSNLPGIYAIEEVTPSIGDLIRLIDYGSGGWAVLECVEPANATILGNYRLVGRKLGTIQLINKFVNTATHSEGYDQTQSYDAEGYDASAAKEFRLLLNAVKNKIFIDEMAVEWNKLFFANIHYVFSEQHYVDWAFKTSFLNAIHNVGYFSNRPNYKSDGLASYQKYIEEVKPYRTKVREFTSRYLGLDNTRTAFSDFDVPPVYNAETNTIDAVKSGSYVLDTYPWKYWVDNHTYSITDIVITFPGLDYTSVPYVVIEGGGGTGAAAKAFLSNGKVSRVVVTNPGSGFTSAPSVYIVGGVGTRVNDVATAVAFIGDTKARTFNMTVKFDRYSTTPGFRSLSTSEKFIETEILPNATGKQTVWGLKYPPTEDKSKISVIVGGVKLLKTEYSITLYTTTVNGLTVLKGRITLNTAPAAATTVRVVYEKNDEVLDALNRIDKYYKPDAGMLGLSKKEIVNAVGTVVEVQNDYSQLVTGIDFGGVIVQGATFDVSGGWDALPWFTDGWDSADRLTSDFYLPADGTTNEFTLPAVPAMGVEYTVYIKKNGTDNSIRLDDPNFDAYIANPSLPVPPNPYAVMNTWIGDGSTATIIIPPVVTIERGDVMIFRPFDSDGVSTISDKNMLDVEISGGTLNGLDPYATALGRTAEEIIIDGEKFVSPDHVPAPEENIPGQVLESVSIKVFHSDRSGAPAVLSKIYTSNGTTEAYLVGQQIIENSSIIVFVDKVKQVEGTDYTIEHETNRVLFLTIPANGAIIEIFSMNIGGIEIVDYRDFIGDGETRYFLTAAPFSETGHVYATVDGQRVTVGILNSNGFQNDIDKALIEFGTAPETGKQVSIVVFSAESGVGETLTRINQQTFTVNPLVKTYAIESFVTLEASAVGNVILDFNGELLRSVDTVVQTYTGSNPVVTIGQDPFRNAGDIVQSRVKVYVNNVPLKFGSDYGFDGEAKTVTVASKLVVGDVIRVEDYSTTAYDIVNNNIVLSDAVNISGGGELNLIWFDNYSSVDLVKDIFTGGKLSYPLQRAALGISYIWVYLNGDRLTPDIDFWIDYPRNIVYLKTDTTTADFVEILSYSGDIYNKPFGFEIFKDSLNKFRYVRYNDNDIKLAKELNYYDSTITITDASNLVEPTYRQLGIVQINGEKIQYLSKTGNVLNGLRRGLYGTAIGEQYATGSTVVDVSTVESLPYREYQERHDVLSDGSTLLIGPLPAGEYGDPTEAAAEKYIPQARKTKTGTKVAFSYRKSIPADHYPCDEIEVFVGGRRLRKDPITVFDPTVGAYSPVGDVTLEAEFSVDGTTSFVRLTSPAPAGQQVTIIKRRGNTWYNTGKDAGTASDGKSLSKATTAIAKFLQNKATKLP